MVQLTPTIMPPPRTPPWRTTGGTQRSQNLAKTFFKKKSVFLQIFDDTATHGGVCAAPALDGDISVTLDIKDDLHTHKNWDNPSRDEEIPSDRSRTHRCSCGNHGRTKNRKEGAAMLVPARAGRYKFSRGTPCMFGKFPSLEIHFSATAAHFDLPFWH